MGAFFPFPDDPRYTFHGSMGRVPENVSYLASSPDEKVSSVDIGFKWSAASQHVSIVNYQPASYYEDYFMTTTYSEKMQNQQASQLAKLISLHDKDGGPKSFVEIGCGDGSFMNHARTRIERVVGIEASRRFAAAAAAAGNTVIIGYVSSNAQPADEKFDAFVSRQVFEHLTDPLDVLIGIRKMLNSGAVGLIEVPNGQRALRLKRFYEFFPDHVNYYSVNSLVALASDAGLNVISCNEAFGGDYLELWLRNDQGQEQWFQEMVVQRDRVCAVLADNLKSLTQGGDKLAVWGCGAKTLCILSASAPGLVNHIACIIDSDPNKQGRFVPNTTIPVVSVADAAGMNIKTVLILALSYREEIAALARSGLPECRRILTLDDYGVVIDL